MIKPWIKFIVLLGLLLSACGSSNPEDVYHIVAEPTLRSGDTVPQPTGPVVLSLTGKIGLTNVGDNLDFDMETLERVGMVEYQVDDLEYDRTVTLRGPLLKDVLAIAKMQPDAQSLYAVALNQYAVTIPLEVLQWPVIIATWRDNKRMPFSEKGPIQIAFPNRSYDIDPLKYNPMWVWHLRTLTIE